MARRGSDRLPARQLLVLSCRFETMLKLSLCVARKTTGSRGL